MKNLTLVFCILFPFQVIFAQSTPTPSASTVEGIVTNELEELLIGATLFWKDNKTGTVTDAAGRFSLPARSQEATLVVHYVGYSPAEVQVLPGETNLWIEVKGVSELKQVTITEHGFDSRVSLLDARNVERINSKELRKAPCCNLSESFETNGAVDVVYANALTGVKEIQMLGLRGVYGQFMVENRPTMGGIATPFAFEYIPGTWLDGIQLAKGASTVKNGFAGITGQINAELVKPQLDKPLFVNAFSSTEGRGELNVHLNKKGKGQISNGLLLHGSFVENRWDMNSDNFYDAPNRKQINGLYRVFYESPQMCGQFNVQAFSDRRTSGQIRPMDGKSVFFGIQQNNDRLEAWGKMGREGLWGRPYNQLGNIVSASWHRNNSVFGPNRYDAVQSSFYWQSLLQTILGTTDHQIVVAPSFQYDDIRESVNETVLDRREAVPGLMAEYSYNRPDLEMGIPDLVIVAGARLDWNSRFGWLFTPRMSAKYNFNTRSVMRVSAGRGFRSPNLAAENISLLASNRPPDFTGALGLGVEEAWNYGLNFSQEFKVLNRTANFTIDAYRTHFVRQIIADVDQWVTRPVFYRVDGPSFSNSLLGTLQYNPLPGLDIKVAYKWNDVRATYAGGDLRSMPLIAKHRGLIALDYTTPGKKWAFNSHLQMVGPQRLPDNSKLPHPYNHALPQTSPTYATLNAQITRHWRKFDLYFGGENLTGVQQHVAIIAADNPESPYFNGSQLYAPMMGAVGYVGLRFSPSGL